MTGPDPVPFVCVDCGCDVYRWDAAAIPAKPARCATCQWLADVPDALDRERLRAWLASLEATR
jgi:hypothetical protein